MQNDQAAQDARRLLVAISINHPEARMVSPSMMDRPFSPSWADAEQAGLDRVRRDAAMEWLVDNDLLEREEEAESPQGQGEGLPDYDYVYGSVFRITDSGRELLEEIWEERGPGGASSMGGDGTMGEKRQESTHKVAEELSKLQQKHAHLAALERLAASYPENHSTRLVSESLELYKARTVVEGEIVALRGSLGYGTTGYGTL